MNVSILEKSINSFDDIINKQNKIFELVNNGEWSKLKQLINKENKDFNYDIKNNQNINLIEYLILFNKIDIIKLIIDNVKIDIIDENGRSILYNIIKFSYVEILILVLDKNVSLIGKDILEIYDNEGNNSLMYCILFNNITCLNILCKYIHNFYSKNINGINSLHYSIINSKYDIFVSLSKYYDLNIRTNKGETPLLLSIKTKNYEIFKFLLQKKINYNISEDLYNYTALHYISIIFNIQICTIVEPYIQDFEGNFQDKSGNIFYHYFVNNLINYDINNVNNIFTIYKKVIFNYNLKNIDGNIPAHIFLENIDKYETYKEIFIDLIINSDLNIQNNNGDSCLFLLIKKNYWIHLSDILIKKSLDVFILNAKRENMFKYILPENKDEFIKIIINSYLYQLKHSKKIFHLNEDKKCNELLTSNKKNDCYDIVFNKITEQINFFMKNNIITNTMFSYPKSRIYPVILDKYNDVINPSYSSTTINIFFGLYYLSKKYNNIKSPINLIKKNTILINFNNTYYDFINYSLMWINFKFVNHFNNLEGYLKTIINDFDFFIIPLGIEIYDLKTFKGHANYIIFDLKKKHVERYEPYGAEPPFDMNYDYQLLDNVLEIFVLSLNLNFTYISPIQYLPKISFQYKEIYELKNNYIGDPDGFCSVWCILWTDLRIKHSQILPKKLELLINKEIINNNYQYKKIIRNYSKNITDIRDYFLNKINTNINEWNNDKLDNIKILKLQQLIKQKILNT